MADDLVEKLEEQRRGLLAAGEAIRERVYAHQHGEWRGDDAKWLDELLTQAQAVDSRIRAMGRCRECEALKSELAEAKESAERAYRAEGEARAELRNAERELEDMGQELYRAQEMAAREKRDCDALVEKQKEAVRILGGTR